MVLLHPVDLQNQLVQLVRLDLEHLLVPVDPHRPVDRLVPPVQLVLLDRSVRYLPLVLRSLGHPLVRYPRESPRFPGYPADLRNLSVLYRPLDLYFR